MLKSIRFAVLFFAFVGEARADERHVVLILIDGLPAYLLDDPNASMPEIRKPGARKESRPKRA